MSWLKLDDSMGEHRKTRRLIRTRGLDALGLHTQALLHCSRYLTDGFVDVEFVEEMLDDGKVRGKNRAAIVESLVECGQWVVANGGWLIHDYLEHNPSKHDVETKRGVEREKKQAAGRKGAEVKWRKERINQEMRQAVATRLGFETGAIADANCEACGCGLVVDWTDAKRVRFFDLAGSPTPELDHIDPLSRGGAHEASNLRLTCLSCNRSKGASLSTVPDISQGTNGSDAKGVHSPVPSRPVPLPSRQAQGGQK